MKDSYLKVGAVQDTAYWSENQTVRSFSDTKVTLVLFRPSLSNTMSYKAGSDVKLRIAIVQTSGTTPGERAFGEGNASLYLVDSSYDHAISTILLSTCSLAILSLSLFI